jgi:hypothetical protein
MAMQYAEALRNAQLDTIESHIGTSAILEIRTGAQPANVAAADSGTLLASLNLPSDWLANAASGAIAKSGSWTGTAVAAGTAAHFRLKTNGGTAKIQGSCGIGTGDLQLDNTNITVGQAVTVTGFTISAGNS